MRFVNAMSYDVLISCVLRVNILRGHSIMIGSFDNNTSIIRKVLIVCPNQGVFILTNKVLILRFKYKS